MDTVVPERMRKYGLRVVLILGTIAAVGDDDHGCWKRKRGKRERNGLEEGCCRYFCDN